MLSNHQMLRGAFKNGVEDYLITPWTAELAETRRAHLLAEAEKLAHRANTSAPNMSTNDAMMTRNSMLREASIIRTEAQIIPSDDFEGAYIRTIKHRIASIQFYAGLVRGESIGEARTAADRTRAAQVSLPSEARIALRDILDQLAAIAGYPEWRKTFGRILLGHPII
jgi:hypothetical protein